MSGNRRKKRRTQLQIQAYKMCTSGCRVKCSRCLGKCRTTHPKGARRDKKKSMSVPYTLYVPPSRRKRKGARFPGRGRVLKTGAVKRRPRKKKKKKKKTVTRASIERKLGGKRVPRTPAARAALHRRLCRDLDDQTTVAELRQLATELQIRGRSKLKRKSQLCRAVAKAMAQ